MGETVVCVLTTRTCPRMSATVPSGFPSSETTALRETTPRTRIETNAGVAVSVTKRTVRLRPETLVHVSPSARRRPTTNLLRATTSPIFRAARSFQIDERTVVVEIAARNPIDQIDAATGAFVGHRKRAPTWGFAAEPEEGVLASTEGEGDFPHESARVSRDRAQSNRDIMGFAATT